MHFSIAQQVKPEGAFAKAAVKLGEPVAYVLVMRHPADMEVRFPDTLFNYKPFELVAKKYFHTQTDASGISTDSAIYTLTTFQTDSLLHFALPVIVMRNGDTTMLWTDSTSIVVEKIVPATDLPTAKLIPNTAYFTVNKGWNYPYIGIGLLVFLLLSGIVYWLFGERIRKAFRLQRLRRRFERFMNEYMPYTQQKLTPEATDHALALWKSYLQGLQGIPFTTYTSKEIAAILPNKALEQTLKQLDLAIYGKKIDEQTVAATLFLADFAKQAYQQKVEEVRNA
ncbi:MAG: hypothetical protein RMJ87_07805 [Cytophagales bacterium]|nr:hypothetical protein [Bernardetiaceae bacterium]MDW8204916.1 hypothetical protein [Cytophagales bacterium]